MSEIIYLYQVGNNGTTYEKPRKETIQDFAKRKDTLDESSLTLKEDVQKFAEAFVKMSLVNTPDFFVGTQSEYDAWAKPKILSEKVNVLKAQTADKLAAYIIKCEDFLTQHIGDVKANTLKTYLLPNGKLDTSAIETSIKDNQEKTDSMSLLCECYLGWLLEIDKGTEASLATLPDTDPTKLNIIIDNLWKAEHDKERKALIAKLNSSEDEFKVVDKYSNIVSGDEPEIK